MKSEARNLLFLASLVVAPVVAAVGLNLHSFSIEWIFSLLIVVVAGVYAWLGEKKPAEAVRPKSHPPLKPS